MAKMTLLEMVQQILSSMDSDDVNSIFDTVESEQVANAIRDTYFEIIAGQDYPEAEKLDTLNGISDTSKPNYLAIPDSSARVRDVQYKVADSNGVYNYKSIIYLEPQEFIEVQKQQMGNMITVTDFNLVDLNIRNDKDPDYWTTFDDVHLIFDSYNALLETTLHASKSLCLATTIPSFIMSDAFVPYLDADVFPLFLAEAKSSCFVNFKQVSNSKEEQRSRRQRVKMQSKKWRASQRDPERDRPDYGRRGTWGRSTLTH